MAFIRKWQLRRRAVANSLEEKPSERLFTLTRLPASQWGVGDRLPWKPYQSRN